MAEIDHNTEVLEEVQVYITDVDAWSIVLYNDDVNTFEWVILCLKKYCGHNHIQAEQCAWVVHTKGKCMVKNGSVDSLQPICQALCDSGLSATIENI
jgi:ATP-dependent Clp protease adaptor protein ClpS